MNFSPNLSNKLPMVSQSESRLRGMKISSSRILFGGKSLICLIVAAVGVQFLVATLVWAGTVIYSSGRYRSGSAFRVKKIWSPFQ